MRASGVRLQQSYGLRRRQRQGHRSQCRRGYRWQYGRGYRWKYGRVHRRHLRRGYRWQFRRRHDQGLRCRVGDDTVGLDAGRRVQHGTSSTALPAQTAPCLRRSEPVQLRRVRDRNGDVLMVPGATPCAVDRFDQADGADPCPAQVASGTSCPLARASGQIFRQAMSCA